LNDIPIEGGVDEIIDGQDKKDPYCDDRDQYPEKGPFSATGHQLTNLPKRRIQGFEGSRVLVVPKKEQGFVPYYRFT
jgi:hypothetical protein